MRQQIKVLSNLIKFRSFLKGRYSLYSLDLNYFSHIQIFSTMVLFS